MSRNLKLLISLILIGTVSAFLLLVTIPTMMAKRSYEGAKTLAEDFRKAFQFTPEVRVNSVVVLNQQVPSFELAVISQDFEHRYTWENSWLRSTKKIFISGTFSAKVGFDLHDKFSITLRDNKAFVSLPAPVTLSVESHSDIQYRDQNGIWNWVDIDDRTRATNAFISDARRFANRAPFVNDARKAMEDRLRVFLKPYADEVIVDYRQAVQKRNL